MASVQQQLINSVLSAENIKQLTDWPPELILDYLTIIENLNNVATSVDTTNSNVSDIDDAIGDIDGSIESIQTALTAINNELVENDNLTNFIQLTMNQLRGLINQLSRRVDNLFPANGAELHAEGNDTSDPTLSGQYNVTSLTRISRGEYRAALTQSISGQVVPVVNSTIAPDATSAIFNVNATLSNSTQLDISVTQIVTDINANPYDLQTGDTLDIMLLNNIGGGLLNGN